MSLEFTTDDLLILERYRMERLRSRFADTLSLCFVHLDHSDQLTIHCPEPWLVDQLLNEMDRLRWYVRTIIGARHLSLCFAQEEVCIISTSRQPRKMRRIRCA
jgi:hypothetical protein